MKTSISTQLRPAGISLTSRTVRRATSFSLLQTLSTLSAVRSLALIFSQVMDERVTPRQTLCIVQAFLALLLTVFSLCVPMLFRLLCVVWLFVALRQCKAEGLGE